MPGLTQRVNTIQPHKYRLGNEQLCNVFEKKGMGITMLYKITSFNNDIVLYM